MKKIFTLTNIINEKHLSIIFYILKGFVYIVLLLIACIVFPLIFNDPVYASVPEEVVSDEMIIERIAEIQSVIDCFYSQLGLAFENHENGLMSLEERDNFINEACDIIVWSEITRDEWQAVLDGSN